MLRADTYVALDLEMTGLNPKQDRIIEIGAVLVERDEIRAAFSTLINPRCQLQERTIEITGITQAEVDGAPRLEEKLTELSEFIGDRALLGHSILSDYSFLKRAYVNAGISFEKKGIDTLRLARKYLPQLPSKRLADLCVYYQIPQQAHRAMEDAVAAHLLYQRLWYDFGSRLGEKEVLTEDGNGNGADGKVAQTLTEGREKNDFCPRQLIYKVKKEAPASKKQKERLLALIEKHTLSMTIDIDSMSKNEISRMTDQILAKYGR